MQARYERRERKRNSDAGCASTQPPDLEELGLSCIPTADEDFTISHGTFAAPVLLEKARNPRRKAPSMTVAPLATTAFKLGKHYTVIHNRLFFAVHEDAAHTERAAQDNPHLVFFSSSEQEDYVPFCDDFGPVDLAAVVSFCSRARSFLHAPSMLPRKLVYYVHDDEAHRTNAACAPARPRPSAPGPLHRRRVRPRIRRPCSPPPPRSPPRSPHPPHRPGRQPECRRAPGTRRGADAPPPAPSPQLPPGVVPCPR